MVEAEFCEVHHVHENLAHQIEDGMPGEKTMQGLAEFYKVFGDVTRTGRCSHSEHFESGNETHCRIRGIMKKNRWILLFVISTMLLGCKANIKDGITYLEEEKYEAAIQCFEKDITEKENLGDAYRGMGIAHYELGDFRTAIEHFENALANEEEATATIYSLMAASYLQIEEYESALDYYAKALKMEECTEELKQEILFNEIAIYQELSDWDTLKEKVSSYVERYPEDNRMDKTVEFLETR